MADYLEDLVARLSPAAQSNPVRRYRIPALWHQWEYPGALARDGDEVVVDPHDYLRTCIVRTILPARPGRGFGGRSLSALNRVRRHTDGKVHDGGRLRRAGDWVQTATIYGMLVRMTTAWDHDANGRLTSSRFTETGTFLKSILLLPLLRRMGVDVIYMLPVSRHSDLYRKGELGCPYAARNFTLIEPRLHDRLLGDDPEDLELEFGAFVEAAHRMDMRVMVDLAPRSAARDHDWLLDHPEWFYWIDRRFAKDYAAPQLPGVTYLNPIASRLDEVYGPSHVRRHLAKFRHAPNLTAPARWSHFARQMRQKRPRDLLGAIGREFGVITPPGFSDVINDRQPPWSDVTFLRMYLDHPTAAREHLPDPKAQPPYILFDVIKSSLFPGRRPNRGLWRALADVLPFYQRFGIDGARVDMAHALPQPLERSILDRPRRADPDFCFMAEELGTENDAKVRRAGYNLLIGPSWYMEPRAHEGLAHRFVHRVLPGLKVPALAAAETPDTPRAVTRRGGRRFARVMAVLNAFLPRAIPFINSGLECHERQPMNLGLDATPRDRRALPPDDPFHGKLAFFDPFILHWQNRGARSMVKLLCRVADIRRRYIGDLVAPRNYFAPEVLRNARRVLAVGFRVERRRKALVVLANLDCRTTRRAVVSGLAAPSGEMEVLFRQHSTLPPPTWRRGRLSVRLGPGDALVAVVS
jgi:hypothetical protein